MLKRVIRVGPRRFPRSRQRNSWTCGSRCVHAILKHFGMEKSHKLLVIELGTNDKDGTTVKAMDDAIKARELSTVINTNTSIRQLTKIVTFGVAVLHIDGDHFILAHGRRGDNWLIMDPMGKPDKISTKILKKRWIDKWSLAVYRKYS